MGSTRVSGHLPVPHHSRLHHEFIHGLQSLGSQSVKGAVEGTALRHRPGRGNPGTAQGVSVRDPFAQFTIVQSLTRIRIRERKTCTESIHRDRWRDFSDHVSDRPVPPQSSLRGGRENWRWPAAGARARFLVASTLHPRHRSVASRPGALIPPLSSNLVPRLLQSLEISRSGLVQQFLQSTPVVQPAPNFGHQFLRHIKGKPAPLLAAVEDIAGVLFPGKTRRAIGRTQGLRRRLREPSRAGQSPADCCCHQCWTSEGTRIWFAFGCHDVCIIKHIYMSREKYKFARNSSRKIADQPAFMRGFEFRARN